MIKTLLKPLSFLPAILLMIAIYQFSAQPASVSTEVSRKVSLKLVQLADYVLDTDLDDWQMEEYAIKINGVTRKLAHMTEYFLLAIAVAFPLYVYGLRGFHLMFLVGLICVGFACSDEYHQAFVAGRAPSKKDVGIDSFGVFWGIILVRMIGFWGRHTIFEDKPEPEKIFIPITPVPVNPSMVQPIPVPPVPVQPIPVPSAPNPAPIEDTPLPVNPDDPFQDWLDDYFPEK